MDIKTFEINYFCEASNSKKTVTVKAETMQSALYLADTNGDYIVSGDPLPVHIKDWDYKNDISIECIEDRFKYYFDGFVQGENISKLFISENDVKRMLDSGLWSVAYDSEAEQAVCYADSDYFHGDNWFYFESDVIQTSGANIENTPNAVFAKEIHKALDEIITEFPDEYLMYKLMAHDKISQLHKEHNKSNIER